MSNIARAIELAASVHNGQTDKGGEPYILHALTVMEESAAKVAHLRYKAENFRSDVMIVGVLHDAVEDFDGPPVEKIAFRETVYNEFGPTVFDALEAITHPRDESYAEYIERVAQNPIARIVKIADLTHNMDPRRMPAGKIGEKEYERWEKYRRALVRLERED